MRRKKMFDGLNCRQLPMGAGHCQWSRHTNRNMCMSVGPMAAAGGSVTNDGRTDRKLGNI